MNFAPYDQEGLPDYWGIETYPDELQANEIERCVPYQEGLPDYWGIETTHNPDSEHHNRIRKDYPTTGVLNRNSSIHNENGYQTSHIRKDYPTTGVLKLIVRPPTYGGLWAFL